MAVALCLRCDTPVTPPVELCSSCHAEWLREEEELNRELAEQWAQRCAACGKDPEHCGLECPPVLTPEMEQAWEDHDLAPLEDPYRVWRR